MPNFCPINNIHNKQESQRYDILFTFNFLQFNSWKRDRDDISVNIFIKNIKIFQLSYITLCLNEMTLQMILRTQQRK